MNETFDGSFKIYMEPENNHPGTAGVDTSRRGPGDDMHSLEAFSAEVDNVKGDLLNVEKFYAKLQESNEELKKAQNAKAMKELRARLIMDLDQLFRLAKQINRKYDGLVRANAAQRKITGSGPGSSDDQARASMISQLVESLQLMMRKFQGLRAQMETDNRQLIEARYFAITREKAPAEAIDNLIASEAPEGPLHQAIQELGHDAVVEAVAEIQERRDIMREVRRNLMALHQVFLGIATPVVAVAAGEGQGGGNRAGGLPSPVENFPAAAAAYGGAKAGTGGLNDYEKETRRQAYIAIILALVIIVGLIFASLKAEDSLEKQAGSATT